VASRSPVNIFLMDQLRRRILFVIYRGRFSSAMKNSDIIKRDLKIFTFVSSATGFVIFLFSLVGHILTPGQLIPSSFLGGTVGLVAGIYFCFKQNYIEKVNVFPVLLCSLCAFGIVSFVSVFNFNNPLLILSCFLLLGLTTIVSNHYFLHHCNISTSKFYGTIGILLSFPALYFMVASILKFRLGYSLLFSPIGILLNQTSGQSNFNAITPFLFGGGVLLAFALNLFSQLEFQKANEKILHYRISGIRVKILNLIVLITSGFVGLTIISYLIAENFF